MSTSRIALDDSGMTMTGRITGAHSSKNSQLKPGAKVFELGAHQAVVALMVSRFVAKLAQYWPLSRDSTTLETLSKTKSQTLHTTSPYFVPPRATEAGRYPQ